MPQYRSEWKYICTDGQLDRLRAGLEGALAYDSHADESGSYPVHSLYFDDHTNSCAAGNESGDGLRYKYRIRYYGSSPDRLILERKEKKYGFGGKTGCPVTIGEYNALISGDVSRIFWGTDKPLLKKFCALIMTRGFTPKAVIDYDRTAFIEPAAHIRITFDRNISAAGDCGAYLSGSYMRYPLQNIHQNILEVKFDAVFPGWLHSLLDSMGLKQTSFSKYYYARKRLEGILR